MLHKMFHCKVSCHHLQQSHPVNSLKFSNLALGTDEIHKLPHGRLPAHHCIIPINELTHEIMALIVLRKLNLQTRMRSNSLWLHIWFLVRPFVYFHTLCVRTAKALRCLAWAFAVRLCDKYHNLMSWLKSWRNKDEGSIAKPTIKY